MGGFAQRTDKIENPVTLVQGSELDGGLSDFLKYESQFTSIAAEISNSQGNSLTFLMYPDNHKLAGRHLGSNQRGIHDK
jgi:hypothetical protein